MIRIWRGKEPADLAKARRRYLARACLAWAGGASARVDRDDDQRQEQRNGIDSREGYHVARGDLHRAQHQKCAYCERQEGLVNQPVEHFRPKCGAVRDVDDARSIDHDHYFWLAWSWENLFFTCTSCNGRGTKGNKFPLLEDVTKLPLPSRTLILAWPDEHFDRTREKAALVDPSREDPMNFIRWIPINPDATWEQLECPSSTVCG